MKLQAFLPWGWGLGVENGSRREINHTEHRVNNDMVSGKILIFVING